MSFFSLRRKRKLNKKKKRALALFSRGDNMQKNEKVYGICTGYTHDGHGVVKVDGFPLFVKGMMKGEEGI